MQHVCSADTPRHINRNLLLSSNNANSRKTRRETKRRRRMRREVVRSTSQLSSAATASTAHSYRSFLMFSVILVLLSTNTSSAVWLSVTEHVITESSVSQLLGSPTVCQLELTDPVIASPSIPVIIALHWRQHEPQVVKIEYFYSDWRARLPVAMTITSCWEQNQSVSCNSCCVAINVDWLWLRLWLWLWLVSVKSCNLVTRRILTLTVYWQTDTTIITSRGAGSKLKVGAWARIPAPKIFFCAPHFSAMLPVGGGTALTSVQCAHTKMGSHSQLFVRKEMA